MNGSQLRSGLFVLLASAGLAAQGQEAASSRNPDPGRRFEVTITNVTRGQAFTPVLVATHTRRIGLFDLGAPASDGLAILAEGGDTAPLAAELVATGQALDVQTIPGLLAPGASISVQVRARGRFDRVSLAAMLIPTNDSFMAVDGILLPWSGGSVSRVVTAYDAGSEPNDELCASIPGPVCGGQGASAGAGGEGYVHVSAGIHGVGDLDQATYDWRNPVALVIIRRID